jgi:hypothetical protein
MLLRSFVALGGVLLLFVLLQAQPPAKPGDAPPAPPAGPETAFKGGRLSVDEPTDRDWRDYQKMARGQDDPQQGQQIPAERRKELFDKIPRFLIYRLTWEEIHEGREKLTTRDIMEGSQGDYGILQAFPLLITFNKPAQDPDEQAKRERQQKYMVEFRQAASGFLREVLKNRLLVARLNAAIVLERFTDYGQEEVADDLLAILDNPNENDAVKVWAIKGLGKLLANAAVKAPKDPKRIERCALAAYAWLDTRTKTPPALVAELSEPEKDGIRFVRKAAIRALAEYRRPMIVDDPKANRREGPVAGLLLRIMNNEENSVSPDASWSEREEAAVGLCHLQSKQSTTYQPDFVAYQVSRFIAALGAEANRDASRNTQRWQFFAAQLKAGTDALTADLKGNPSAAYLSKLMAGVNPVLENLYDDKKSQTAVGDLNESLNALPPKGTDVYNPPMAKN